MESVGSIWQALEQADAEYLNSAGLTLNISNFNKIAITSHSTRIEGSTLTMSEALHLIEKGIPATGKQIDHQNMVLDHYEALDFVIECARKKTPVTLDFIKSIAAKTMRRTGKTVNAVLGNTNESLGDLRKVNVSAGGTFFVDQAKVPTLVQRLIENLNRSISTVKSTEEIYTLAFEAHFDLVSIHPFTDGNGRTARLLMNYIECYHNRPMTVVYAEDKAFYFDCLNTCRQAESTTPIIQFLADQHIKFLSQHITAYQKQLDPKIKSQQEERKDNPIGYSLFF